MQKEYILPTLLKSLKTIFSIGFQKLPHENVWVLPSVHMNGQLGA